MLAFSVSERRPRRLIVRARAKVNLGLEVLGPRADGYHELLTLLSAVDLADRVTLEATAGPLELSCDTPGVPAGPDNLAWRAADLLRREAGVETGARIGIEKTIPVAAGLGGGSADAAAVLWGLSRLWGLPLDRPALQALGARLGMDVPFFLADGPALGSGRGECLAPVPVPPTVTLVVVNPGIPLATRDVYAALRPEDMSRGARVRALVAALPGGARAIASRLWNGLERPAAGLWPGLREVEQALLEAGALGVVMSGSGPTVVGIAASAAAGARIRKALQARPWRAWVTRTVAGPALSVVRTGPAGHRTRRRQSSMAWGVAKR